MEDPVVVTFLVVGGLFILIALFCIIGGINGLRVAADNIGHETRGHKK